jgi:hypothetical protein
VSSVDVTSEKKLATWDTHRQPFAKVFRVFSWAVHCTSVRCIDRRRCFAAAGVKRRAETWTPGE